MASNRNQLPANNRGVKNFTAWNILKSTINSSTGQTLYKERDIWWMSLGHNVGDEEDGKGALFTRPVLVVKGFSKQLFWGIPLSTTAKTGVYYYHFSVNGIKSTALLSQLRAFDAKRLVDKHGMISIGDFANIRKKLRAFIE